MKFFWTFLMILSSCFAIPVSCTGGMFAGANYLSHHRTLSIDDDSVLQENFYILSTDNQGKLDYFSYKDQKSVDNYLENYPNRSFTLKKVKGDLAMGTSLKNTIEFYVLKQSKALQTQTIELHYSQDTKVDTVVRYQSTAKSIKPISQRTYSMALLFDAFPYALAFAILFSILGKASLSAVNRKSSCLLSECK